MANEIMVLMTSDIISSSKAYWLLFLNEIGICYIGKLMPVFRIKISLVLGSSQQRGKEGRRKRRSKERREGERERRRKRRRK